MERVLATDFAQERNSGILVFNDFLEERLSAQAGAFRNADGTGNDKKANDGYVLTGRITGLLIDKPEKKQLLHLGVAHSFRVADNKEFSISSRPEAHMGPKYINTGTMENIQHANITNFEAAFVHHSLSFQGEYILGNYKKIDFDLIDSYNFASVYGQVSYFITGESKKFKSSYSGFGRVKPNKNFGIEKGSGAWEVAVRVSNSDLNSEDIFGGEQLDITLGVNWYLNPATRIMINYVRADIKDMGRADVIQGRMQIDF
jgi:phosphate-selective porin OprO/OprP